jgi:hypothetical protein
MIMFFVVIEGAIRKWLLPGLQAQIYFLKDIVLVIAYASFFASRPLSGAQLKTMRPLTALLALSLAYFGIELTNSNSPSVVVSMIGLKEYLLYMPLVYVIPYSVSSSDDLERKLKTYLILMSPFVVLGLVQFTFPSDHWINGYLNRDGEELIKGAGFSGEFTNVRAAGTFSYISGFSAFLTVIFYLAAGLAAKNQWRLSGNVWPLVILVVTLAAMFTTGSRGPIWGLVATWPLVVSIWGSGRLLSAATLGKMVVAAVGVSIGALFLAADAFDAYAYRQGHADDPLTRVLAPVTEVYAAMQVMVPFGTGIGSTSSGAPTLVGTADFWWLNGNFFEVETARVLQETGLIGFILVYAARLWLLIKAITLGVRFRTPLYVGLSGVIAGLFLQDLAGVVINNATAGLYHWFAAGLLFAMYRLERKRVPEGQPVRARAHGQPAAASSAIRADSAVTSLCGRPMTPAKPWAQR